jgi:ligand-binding SRPBCC domain-containing protein
MPKIELETSINSTLEICFDLSRSIDLHMLSTSRTNEKAIEGRTSGLIELNEFVTWLATHFGIRQKLTSKITAFNRPFHFRDEQSKGAFKFFTHDHYFEQQGSIIIMKDVFNFQSPFGFVGNLFDKIILKNYMTVFLKERNNTIKEYAETTKWKSILYQKD